MKRYVQRYIGLMVVGASGLLAGSTRAADYLGAAAVLQAVQERHAKPADQATATNEAAQLKADLKTFGQTAGSLPAPAAAQGWLALVDRWVKVQSQARSRMEQYDGYEAQNSLLEVLPPPPAWGELARAVAARPPAKSGGEVREMGLRLLAALLTRDTNAQSQVIASLSAKARESDNGYMYGNYLQQIGQILLQVSENPDASLQLLNNQLDAAAAQGQQQISVPNLVAQVGPEKAGAFLRRALLTPGVTLQFNGPNDTSRLAQKLTLELMPQLKSAQWELINSLDAVELYEAMDRQFSGPTNNATQAGLSAPALPGLPNLASLTGGYDNSGRSQAQIYYLLGLISRDRTTDAVAVAKKISRPANDCEYEEAFKQMEHAGYTTALDNFFHELLSQNPQLPFWNQYVALAAHAGQTDRMVALVRTKLAQTDMSDSQKAALQQILFKALLAADQVDEGVAEIRRLAAADEPASSSQNISGGELGVMLARIGFLLQKPEWTEEGIELARKWLAKHETDADSSGTTQSVVTALAQLLTALNRGPEAEALLTDALAAATAAASDQDVPNDSAQPILVDLAVLYHQAGRPEDVLNLLAQSPNWGAGDVSDLFEAVPEENAMAMLNLHTGSSPLPVPYLAADALLATGQKAAAQKILVPLQDHFPGLDRCYELLIALEGTNAIPQLDAWFKRDQFEERPLIWKAHLLRQENRLEEAETTIRQAIAIDPSDGEEGRGDRMRAYAELSAIRAARGDQKEADFYAEIIKAIRLSENADQYYQAGLLKRAIAMYEEGLNHFSDAYCIQSRLAIQLSDLGKNEEAEEHYRRAYELMPDSFGRVESHCFGCERAFDGEHAQSVAEKVFTKFAAAHPNKPQVHYLLGYLRTEQGRFNEARTNYLTAVRRDPDYLNAWVKLQEASGQVLVPAHERDETAFNILRLDPLRRHTGFGDANVTDLAGLWNIASTAAALQLPPARDLFPLPASKMAMTKKNANSQDSAMMQEMMRYQSGYREGLTPASVIAQTPFVRLAGQMIMSQNREY